MRYFLDHPSRFVPVALAVEGLAAIVGFGTGIDALQAFTRYSGRMGLAWFAVVFLVTPWHVFAPGELSRTALHARRQLGLAFGWHHLAHLAILLTYLHESGHELNLARAAGGMLGYAFLIAMMATSTDAAVRRLGPANWRRLHRTGLWLLWIIFLLTYVPRLQGKAASAGGNMTAYVASTSVIVAIAAARFAAFVARRRRA